MAQRRRVVGQSASQVPWVLRLSGPLRAAPNAGGNADMARDEHGENHADTPTAIGAGAVTGAAVGAAGAGPIGAAIGAVGGAIVGGLTERAMHAGDEGAPSTEDEDDTRYTERDRQALVPGEPALDRAPIITPEMAKEPVGQHEHTWADGRCECGATR